MPPKEEANPAAAKAKPKLDAETLLAAGNVDAAAAAIAQAEQQQKKKKKAKKKKKDDEVDGCLVLLGTLVVLFLMLGAGCAASGNMCPKIYRMVTASAEIGWSKIEVDDHGQEIKPEAPPYVAEVGAVQLTGATFASEIANKGAFVKFLAPW